MVSYDPFTIVVIVISLFTVSNMVTASTSITPPTAVVSGSHSGLNSPSSPSNTNTNTNNSRTDDTEEDAASSILADVKTQLQNAVQSTIDKPTDGLLPQQTPTSQTGNKQKRLNLETMSQSLRHMDYAVRGKVVAAADRIAQELQQLKLNLEHDDGEQHHQQQQQSTKYAFDHIVYTNIGNPHSLGQAPLTWPRQVMALVDLPDSVGVNHIDSTKLFPLSAIQRAKEIKAGLGKLSGSGAYTHSKGVHSIRCDVAKFIQERDQNIPSNPESIFLTNGASSGIHMMLQALISTDRSIRTGVMIPIPQYPIYSATVDLLEGVKVGYYLNEDKGWALDLNELERAYEEAVSAGITVNSFVLINPGNPTGQVLSKENLQDVVKFCTKHRLVLMADEVYQENVYDGEFYSCKRAAYDCGVLNEIELVSFHSISKGVYGECGRRGGYMELTGIDTNVVDEIYKLASSSLCATVSGQVMVSLMVRGPDPTTPEYELHEAEKRTIYESLKRRSRIVSDGLNQIPGFQCQPLAGAMYAFPSISMPQNAIVHATEKGISPDSLYCLSLLQATGICVVPASGFGQREGRFGFRTTILPEEKELQHCMQAISQHYQQFVKEYE
jgi:alanine transaminase